MLGMDKNKVIAKNFSRWAYRAHDVINGIIDSRGRMMDSDQIIANFVRF